MALELQKVLKENLPEARVILTRNFRSYNPKHPRIVTDRRRAEIANQAHAAIMVRLHTDTGRGSGFTLYYPDRQATKNGRTGPSLEVIRRSRQAADCLHAGMAQALASALRDNGVKGESATYIGKKQGALTGSIYSEVPSVTVEMIFLSNPSDARYLNSPAGRHAMAEALAVGIAGYLNRQSGQAN